MGSKEHVEKDNMKMRDEFEKEPLKLLENRKAEIQSLLKDGKITKEEAAGKIERFDIRIKEIQSFNRLTLKQKKDKLTKDCKKYLDKQVAEGKLDKTKADTIFKKYSERINKWDGNGYPKFHLKRCFRKGEKSDIH